ncbi:MAG: NADH-quinone oxidoreductase subunit C [Candidatus Nanopelagicales bacterium]
MSAVADAVRAALDGDVLAVEPGFGPLTIDVAPTAWLPAVVAAADAGATYADVLTAYDELELGFAVVAHVSTPDASDHVLLRTRVPREAPEVASVVGVHRGLDWHERSVHEMFGIAFAGNPDLSPLRLQPSLGAHPLRKDFVLAARVARPWPGEKDPAGDTGRARRRTLPPGVPDGWGPA